MRESGKHLKKFKTPFGRLRYTKAPQGFVSLCDGCNRRFSAILSDFDKNERCDSELE